jgi:Protein of unknown function (DUF4012)
MPGGSLRRWLRRRWLGVSIAGGVCVIFVALGAYAAFEARSHADRALMEFKYLEAHQSEISTAGGRAELGEHLEDARMQSADAVSAFGSTHVLPALTWLPWLGPELGGSRQLLADAATAAASGAQVLNGIDGLEASTPGHAAWFQGLARFGATLRTSELALRGLERSGSGLFGPIGRDRAVLNGYLRRAALGLHRAASAVVVVRSLYGGDRPTTVLVLGENNAEMNDQGAILTFGLVRIVDGRARVVSHGSVGAIEPTGPVEVPASAGTRATFYGLGLNRNWQSINDTADFSWTGRTAAAMFLSATGVRVDDVLAMDVPALASLLGVTGPISVQGIPWPLTEENLGTVLLHDLYVANPRWGRQAARHGELADIASKVFERLDHARGKDLAIARALASELAGRHLLMWSSDPAVQASLDTLGATGRVDAVLPRSTFHVAVESAVAAKLDYYVRVHLDYSVSLLRGGSAWVATSVTQVNTAPAGQAPSYQLGPDGIHSHVPGEYVSNIFFWSPRGSIGQGGVAESGLVVRSASAVTFAQHRSTVTFKTFLPHAVVGHRFLLHLVPQPRLDPALVSVTVRSAGRLVAGPDVRDVPLDASVTYSWTTR